MFSLETRFPRARGYKMKLKKNDFIELNYTARTMEGDVFDTTIKENAPNSKKELKPLKIAIGRGHLLKGLDEKIEGLEIGKHNIKLKAEEAFGKKDAKKLKLMPMSLFRKQDINPYPGLELNIDETLGVVRTVSGGRVIVDFNHPLAGKDVEYEIEILRKIEDSEEKAKALIEVLGIPNKGLKVKDNKLTIILETDIPEQYKKVISDEIKNLLTLTTEFKALNKNKEEEKSLNKEQSSK